MKTNDRKFGLWLAGYYDDFNGARCVMDNATSATSLSENHYDSHHGSGMSREARLNPHYRFSVMDRTKKYGDSAGNTSAPAASKATDGIEGTRNVGLAEFLTRDETRISKGEE